MSPVFAQRAVGLAAAALLAGVFAVALADAGSGAEDEALPGPAVAASADWTAALVGVGPSAPARGRAGDCGWLVLPSTQGVLHPVLPCGTRLYLEYRGLRALTRVVARSPVGDGRRFDLTPRLARRLGLEGVQVVRWTFSR